MISVVKCFGLGNVGDIYCNPCDYFSFADSTTHHDLNQLENWPRSSPVIVGGGGLIYKTSPLARIAGTCKSWAVAWGIGQNDKLSVSTLPDWLNKFDLVGLRNWDTNYFWVPCVSCMNKEFDRPRITSQQHVIFEHFQKPIQIPNIPKMSNRTTSIREVLDHLGSAETVITNSFHGMYWSHLLGKKVILIEPFANRFFNQRYEPAIASTKNWLDAKPITYPDSLPECREANKIFYYQVRNLIG